MYEIKTLENVSFDELSATLNASFADYVAPVSFTAEEVEAYFKVSGVDYAQSFGAFYNRRLVGVLVNAVDTFRGKTVAYDAITGIVPEHRGQNLFPQLFEHARASLKHNGLTHYYLEVITTNTRAYNVYKRIGAQEEREVVFFTGSINKAFYRQAKVLVCPLADFPHKEWAYYEPTFGNRIKAMWRDIDNYQVAYAEATPDNAAVIFSKQGRIMQIRFRGPEDTDLLHEVFTRLADTFETVKISNIPLTEDGLIQELLRMGLINNVNQYEMSLEL